MSVYIVRRLMQSVLVVALMSLLVFLGVNVVGDPVYMFASPDADQAEIERVIRDFGLDRPIYEQYGYFVLGALQGDLGRSYVFGEPALKLILQHMPATLELASVSMLIAIALGVPLGLYAGLNPDAWTSKTIMTGSIFGFSLPSFWVGIMLIMIFAVMLGWLPSTGRGETIQVLGIDVSFLTLDGLSHLLRPALNLALANLSLVIRLTRAGTREVIHQDYIKFARAKGLSSERIIFVHLLRNLLIPVVTVLGMEFGTLVAFAAVTEPVFAWPGMGKLLIDSVQQLDRPVIVAYLMIIVFLFVVINLLVDLLYSVLDPRIRLDEPST
ncbi:MAG: ABC transporter permease [Geminicoccaceae bacterium]